MMRVSDLLADFIEDLGYNINLIEIPMSTPMHHDMDNEFLDLIVFTKGRDGVIPVIATPPVLNWCTIQTFSHNGRSACKVTIDMLGHVGDPHSSSVLYLDDPTLFSHLTAFLDHWYFRIFQSD